MKRYLDVGQNGISGSQASSTVFKTLNSDGTTCLFGRTHVRPIPNFLLSFFCLQSLFFLVVIKLSAVEIVMLKWKILGSLTVAFCLAEDTVLKNCWSTSVQLNNSLDIEEVHLTIEGKKWLEKLSTKCNKNMIWKSSYKFKSVLSWCN